MATITLTPANVRVGASTTPGSGVAGEALVPGDWVYLKAADGKLWKVINSSAAAAAIVGIASTYGAADDTVFTFSVNPNVSRLKHTSAVFTKGRTYIVSDTAGKLMEANDAGTGDYVTVAAVAASTTEIVLLNSQTGVSG